MSLKLQGKRVFLLGDSLSVTGQPGDVLADRLAEYGATVGKDAVGGHAISYFSNKIRGAHHMRSVLMMKNAKDFGPDIVIVFLGTNDYAQQSARISEGLGVIKDWGNGKIFFITPPDFSPTAKGANGHSPREGVRRVAGLIQNAFPGRTLDAISLSSDLTEAPFRSDRDRKIHFTKKGGLFLGERLFQAITGQNPGRKPGEPLKRSGGMGNALVLVGLLVGLWYSIRK